MGCANSKDVTVANVYRPPPTSVSLFDVSTIEEPWLIAKKNDADDEEEEASDDEDEDEEDEEEEEGKKPTTMVPLPLLEKLDGYDLAPASWSEVSKSLEDIKPTLNSKTTENAMIPPKKKKKKKTKKKKTQPPAQATPPPVAAAATQSDQPVKTPPAAAPSSVRGANEEVERRPPPPELTGKRVVKDNPFLMRDRESKGSDGAAAAARWRRRDPFEGYPERRPPGATGGGVVLYTTTLRGVRRTFEDCERARQAVETCAEAVSAAAAAGGAGAATPVVVDERDVSLHGEYLRELRELLADGGGEAAAAIAPPRLFVMGRYIGGADAIAGLAESGKLREMMRWARARGEACGGAKDGRGCEGCGGARFVPCWECGGSCKVVAAGDDGSGGGGVERCAKCNENGLMLCPICH